MLFNHVNTEELINIRTLIRLFDLAPEIYCRGEFVILQAFPPRIIAMISRSCSQGSLYVTAYKELSSLSYFDLEDSDFLGSLYH